MGDRFVALGSVDKMLKAMETLTNEMRKEAARSFGGMYEYHYREAFVRAFQFFAPENAKYRKQLETLNGSFDIAWEEINRIVQHLRELVQAADKAGASTQLRLRDLETPDLQAAYKLRYVPLTLKEYCGRLGFSARYYAFHPLDLINLEINLDKTEVMDMRDVFRLFSPSRREIGLFDHADAQEN
jgi:hypothetical protein